MFTGNLLTAKFMSDVPWAHYFRVTFFNGHESGDYTLKPAAWWLATVAASIEMLVPLLTWSNDPCKQTYPHTAPVLRLLPHTAPVLRLLLAIPIAILFFYLFFPSTVPVYLSIFTFMGMHAFIIATLIIDVFAWNFTDACWYVILYGILSTGVDWTDYGNMHPLLTLWFIVHGCYVIYGHIYVDEVPYVVAHRHAAGNWSQGVLVVKKTAAAKLGKVKAHAGIPGQAPGWMGEWFAFWGFWAYTWNWNMPNKMLPPMVLDAMGDVRSSSMT
jgi:hypothetical protein